MAAVRNLLLVFFALAPGFAAAALSPAQVPGTAVWYLHVDIDELRRAESGGAVYAWLEREVFDDVRDDLGIDLHREADSVTAYSDAALGTVIVVDGDISDGTRDKLLALAAADAALETRSHARRSYVHARRDEVRKSAHSSLNDLDRSAYFSFDVAGKLIVTSDEKQMQALLDRDGRIAGNQDHRGALLVLTAEGSIVQAGMRAPEVGSGADGWDSNILRNTEQVALLVADSRGGMSIEARLVSREAAMARSLAGIMNGLISLQMLNEDLEPRVRSLIENTRIEVKDAVLSINALLDAATIRNLLGEADARAAVQSP